MIYAKMNEETITRLEKNIKIVAENNISNDIIENLFAITDATLREMVYDVQYVCVVMRHFNIEPYGVWKRDHTPAYLCAKLEGMITHLTIIKKEDLREPATRGLDTHDDNSLLEKLGVGKQFFVDLRQDLVEALDVINDRKKIW